MNTKASYSKFVNLLISRTTESDNNKNPHTKRFLDKQYGYYPEIVLADQLYGSRENRSYLKERGIRYGGKALGRPPKKTAENAERLQREKKQRMEDSRERIPIEGKFGQGKNGYRLNYIRARLQKTSEAWINSIFLVMNLMVLLRELYEKLNISLQFDLFCIVEEFVVRLGRTVKNFFSPAQIYAGGA